MCVSVTALDAALLRRMEPGTPPPLRCLEPVGRLVEAGIPAGVMAVPVLPSITDDTDSLAALAAAARVRRRLLHGRRAATWADHRAVVHSIPACRAA
jgi:DNA repair photolyase